MKYGPKIMPIIKELWNNTISPYKNWHNKIKWFNIFIKSNKCQKIRKEKSNILIQKFEDSKIQIISKDKDKEKDNKKNNSNNNSKNKDRKSIKEVINDLFTAKDIVKNIKNQNNEILPNEKKENKSEKKKYNSNIDNNKQNI